jgi:hypothetical protein
MRITVNLSPDKAASPSPPLWFLPFAARLDLAPEIRRQRYGESSPRGMNCVSGCGQIEAISF